MTWQGVSEAECYDNRSVMAQIMRLKDRVRALEEEGSEEIEHEIELINEELTILERKVGNNEANIGLLAGRMTAVETGKANVSALTDGSVTKVGTSTVGSLTVPIYLNNGTPSTCGANFLMRGVNNVGAQGVTLTADSYENRGALTLRMADLVTENDSYYRRWDGYNTGNTAMWGWDIAIQNDKDNAFDIEIDVICDTKDGDDPAAYNRFRLTTNGVADTESSPKVPPTLELVCEFGDPSMLCVSRLNISHWTTDFTIWHVYARVGEVGASTNRMPAIRINKVLSKTHIHFYQLPTEYHQQYEDVTYGGETIPNVTNYAYYDWQFPTQQGGGGGGGEYYAGTGLSLANSTFSLNSATQGTLAQVANKADDNAVVKLSGAQSVAGVKTFSDSPIVPTPTTDYQAATKKYVDDNAGGSGGAWTTLAAADFGSTGYNLLFTETSTDIIANKDVMIYIRARASNDYGNVSCFIPKGSIVSQYDTLIATKGSGSNFVEWISLRKDVAKLMKYDTTSLSTIALTYSDIKASPTVARESSITINATETPFDNTGLSSNGTINVCVQYR